jgi:hypothetical protein
MSNSEYYIIYYESTENKLFYCDGIRKLVDRWTKLRTITSKHKIRIIN